MRHRHLVTVDIPMIMFLGWAPDFAASLSEVLPWGLRHLTLRDDFILHSPWATGPFVARKMGRVAEYLEKRGVHAPQLGEFRIRIKNSAKDGTWLEDGIRDVGMPMVGSNVRFGVEREKRADARGQFPPQARPDSDCMRRVRTQVIGLWGMTVDGMVPLIRIVIGHIIR